MKRPLEAPVRIEYHMQADAKLVISSTPCTSWLRREQHFYLNRAFPHTFLNSSRTNFSLSTDLIGYYFLTCIRSLVRSGVTATSSEFPTYQFAKGRPPAKMDMDFSEPFDFDAFINWPDDPSAAHAGAEDGLKPLAKSIPDYSADSADQDTHTVTAAPMPWHGDADTPKLGQESSSISTIARCVCIICLGIGVVDKAHHKDTPCRFGCDWNHLDDRAIRNDQTRWNFWWATRDRAAHEKTHYRQGPEYFKNPFSCTVENCRFSSRRWSDLTRHTTARHCRNPSKFLCSVIGCKYHGEGNGFTRKDKLTEHYRKMHQGQKIPSQAARAIMPAPAAFHANARGSSSSGAYGA
ncbi:hypothetical protein BDR22DRAFT_306505 [Usnea florida]